MSLVLGSARSAQADNERDRAREHFDRAVELLKENQYPRALEELRTAYSLFPNPAVLYNIGMTYVALDKPIEAIDNLNKYLTESGANVPAARRAEVERAIQEQARRIGRLALIIEPRGAQVSIDGALVGTAPIDDLIRVLAKTHDVVVSYRGYKSEQRRVNVESGGQTTLRVELEELASTLVTAGIECPVPNANISVDGREVAETPVASIHLAIGARKVEFRRAGYTPSRHAVFASSGSKVLVRCELEPKQPLPAHVSGTIALHVPSLKGIEKRVDGRELSRGGRVPIGAHTIEVIAPGYRRWTRSVNVPRGGTLDIDVNLEPTPDVIRSRQNQRTWAYALGGHGIALLGSATLVFIWNNERYRDWRDQQDDLDYRWAHEQPVRRTTLKEQGQNDQLIESIHEFDRVTVGLAVLGGALLGTGTILFLTGENPEVRPTPELSASRRGGFATWSYRW